MLIYFQVPHVVSVFRNFQLKSVRIRDLPHALYVPQHCVGRTDCCTADRAKHCVHISRQAMYVSMWHRGALARVATVAAELQ